MVPRVSSLQVEILFAQTPYKIRALFAEETQLIRESLLRVATLQNARIEISSSLHAKAFHFRVLRVLFCRSFSRVFSPIHRSLIDNIKGYNR